MNLNNNCKIVSLDTSTNVSGWSVFIDGNYINSGILDFKNEKNSSNRLKNMCLALLLLLDQESPDIVGIETTAVTRNGTTQRVLTMVLGVVYCWCIIHDIELMMLRPSEWRALISDEKKGRKRDDLKKWSKDKVLELFQLEVNDDQSDAILLGQAIVNRLIDGKEKI